MRKAVPAGTQETLPPVSSTERVDIEGEVRIELIELQRVDVKANAPGEIAGPAVRAKVKITNTTNRSIDLDRSTVAVTDSGRSPLSPVMSAPVAPLSGELQASRSSEGTYVFGFPADRRAPLTILVSAAAGTPAAQFVGEPA